MRLKFFLTKFAVFCFVLGSLVFEPNALNAQNQEVVIVGELGVFTVPDSDAEVFIDGIHVGHTPFLKKVEVGRHQLTVKKEMYYDYQEEIVVGDARLDVKIKLEPKYGMLRINTKPVGAMVYFNGIKYPTKTPCISGKIMAGSVAVKIELEDYHTVDTVVTVEEGKIANLYVQMDKQPVFESMAKEVYDYQLSRVYITNDDNNFVELDTTGFRKVSDVTSSIHHDGNTLKNKSKIKQGFWLKGGLGISNVYGKDAYGETINWSTGDYYSVYPTFYIGGQYTLRFNRYVGLAVDLNYSRTGYQYSHNDEVLDYGVINKFTFDGIELPFAFRTYFLKNGYGPMVEFGGMLNYRKYYKVDYSVSTGEKDYLKEKYGSLNWGLVAGVGCDFKIVDVACSINARVVLEMSKVFDDVDYKLIYFQFGIGVKIF